MHRIKTISILIVGVAVLLSAGPDIAMGGNGKTTTLKVAVMIPRNSSSVLEVKKYNKRIAEMTDDAVQVRVYWGGVAGGEQVAVRDAGRRRRAERRVR